jgi:REP element-mobilizing transposase RayT
MIMIPKGDLAMGRSKRQWVSQQVGSFHIISRAAGGTGSDFILQDQEKEYFLKLLERFASGFFVKVHTFAIMSNHFHILAT